ncbi:HpcH/HpaI aldolase family protein [Tranquillimonas alkanivorans]|uniref:4-hydroxy-2-oxoheptanedioate aldolase n=1 Tax=Tranquillimonas alkanivorans TaxID=441119 RepID=A0A1I5TLF1_9RHOB|nr:aldolase/citrate lyase family protein [Tranquillimonas alkanivorans]SFP83880.1 4-hydroxy-2-oxoheptanedioate aldolase [Tranquillimonas alkanivorans]
MTKPAFWMSSPNFATAEIAAILGYEAVVLDIEHGAFDLSDLEKYIPFLKNLGLEVMGKVLGPERSPIQQALDFGADAVVIPHVRGEDHARQVCGYGKFPPRGDRSFAGGRTSSYVGFDDAWVTEQDTKTRCFAMIEGQTAFDEADAILALPVVDGIFIGPSDLSLRRNRGAYTRKAADWDDLKILAESAARAGKPWVLPAWSVEEKSFAVQHGASHAVLTMEHGAIYAGLAAAMKDLKEIGADG